MEKKIQKNRDFMALLVPLIGIGLACIIIAFYFLFLKPIVEERELVIPVKDIDAIEYVITKETVIDTVYMKGRGVIRNVSIRDRIKFIKKDVVD